MSDAPQGPDWYKASDERWYPPQSAAPPSPPPPPMAPPPMAPKQQGMSGCLKVGLIIFALGVVVVIGLVAVISIAGNRVANEVEDNLDAIDSPAVDPSNPDAQKEDQNVALGESVRVSGYTTSVMSAEFQPEISEFEQEGYLVAEVMIENRDDKAQPFNYFDFKLQTPGGQVLDPDFATVDGLLTSGDLIRGGTASGKVVWQIGAAKGDFFVIYKPDLFDAARGLWKVTL